MNIDLLFEKYPENIIGFRINKTTKIIDFWFNNDWEFPKLVDDNTLVQYTVKKQKEDPNTNMTYYVIISETFTFVELFAELSKIIDYNLDIEKKQKLFAQKMNDLKKLFVTLSYEELKEIQFEAPLTLTKQNVVESAMVEETKE